MTETGRGTFEEMYWHEVERIGEDTLDDIKGFYDSDDEIHSADVSTRVEEGGLHESDWFNDLDAGGYGNLLEISDQTDQDKSWRSMVHEYGDEIGPLELLQTMAVMAFREEIQQYVRDRLERVDPAHYQLPSEDSEDERREVVGTGQFYRGQFLEATIQELPDDGVPDNDWRNTPCAYCNHPQSIVERFFLSLEAASEETNDLLERPLEDVLKDCMKGAIIEADYRVEFDELDGHSAICEICLG